MKCDKCGGLVVQADKDELKCLGCSKRFWKELAPMNEKPHAPMAPKLIQFVVGRQAEEWVRFCSAWRQDYPRYEFDEQREEKDEPENVTVWLRLKVQP